jgi:ATP:corrinoid adenosyltransferase
MMSLNLWQVEVERGERGPTSIQVCDEVNYANRCDLINMHTGETAENIFLN